MGAVTAEVASSSLVVPAIPFKHLRKVRLSGVGTKRNNRQNQFPSPASAVRIRFGKIILTTLVCACLLAAILRQVPRDGNFSRTACPRQTPSPLQIVPNLLQHPSPRLCRLPLCDPILKNLVLSAPFHMFGHVFSRRLWPQHGPVSVAFA